MTYNHYFFLPAFVAFDTLRTVLLYGALQSNVLISSTLITFGAEVVKLLFASFFLLRSLRRKTGTLTLRDFIDAVNLKESPGRSRFLKGYTLYAFPALLYFANNILYLIGLQYTTPSLLQAAVLAKLPITAILHHLIVRRLLDWRPWLSLACLSIGLLIFQNPMAFVDRLSALIGMSYGYGDDGNATGGQYLTGTIIGLTIAIISGFTSIYTELIMKQPIPFWTAQFWLYVWGTLFSGISVAIMDARISRSVSVQDVIKGIQPNLSLPLLANTTVIIFTAATGLVVANILRKKDNLVKLAGTSASMVTVAIVQCMLFPHLRAETLTVKAVWGAGIISISTWAYNYYTSVQPSRHSYQPLPTTTENEGQNTDNMESGLNGHISPNTDNSIERPSLPAPTPTRLYTAVGMIAILAYLVSYYQPTEQQTVDILDDVHRFFTPHNITPAVWGETDNPVDCVENFVKSNHITPSSSQLVDWELEFLKSECPVYPVSPGGFIFHFFWRGPWHETNVLAIEAFLATQRLGDGHRVIYWHMESDIPQAVIDKYSTGEWGHYIEFREFHPDQEAAGTCVENMPEWSDKEYAKKIKLRKDSMSDIVRNLLLDKYGGVWVDSDTILLRDLTPLIRSGPSAPAFGDASWNNNLLVFGPPNTRTTNAVLSTTCSLTFNETLYNERFPDGPRPGLFYWVFNEGMLMMCAKVTHCGINRHPLPFMDGVALGVKDQDQHSLKACVREEEGKGKYRLKDGWDGRREPFPGGLHGLWAWHARLGKSKEDKGCLEGDSGTLASAVRKRILTLLDFGLEMNGRNLFPGVGFEPE
ncbi:hypothetical protein NA57DRAFT_80691 [Rhizodiscina lignyota]|uniref:Uncharacterized protein n=1 Tax=Rhizodiscina lignyota TaxID=1504668 RepID=A0A9P4I3A7_9PEZI|nr:hypothetical protein NA57DRAFT_80691 [Rhizodiscina lignyota]